MDWVGWYLYGYDVVVDFVVGWDFDELNGVLVLRVLWFDLEGGMLVIINVVEIMVEVLVVLEKFEVFWVFVGKG